MPSGLSGRPWRRRARPLARHQTVVLRLRQNDNAPPFTADGTFCLSQRLGGSGVSLASFGCPTMSLTQHSADRMIGLATNDGSAGVAADATSLLSPTPRRAGGGRRPVAAAFPHDARSDRNVL